MEDLALFGHDLFGNPARPQTIPSKLGEEFVMPPFSIFDTKQGAWVERKAAWRTLGIESEIGRDEALVFLTDSDRYTNAAKVAAREEKKRVNNVSRGKSDRADGLTMGKFDAEKFPNHDLDKGHTSIFDPVLCELMYRWFSPRGGIVLDPFAGGSVRGIVATFLHRQYYGIDLSEAQIEANRRQAESIIPDRQPVWDVGDSLERLDEVPSDSVDFVFTCPPYGDLEVYSEDPRDLSTMEYNEFASSYRKILRKAVSKLRQDRFAGIVVGEFRDPSTGFYRDFVGLTIRAFQEAGCGLYNEGILVQAIGSLPIRAGRQFRATRKFGKAHQNVLVFLKGDARRAVEAIRESQKLPEEQVPEDDGGDDGDDRVDY